MGSHARPSSLQGAASEVNVLRSGELKDRGAESFPTKQVPEAASLPALNMAYLTAEKNRLKEAKAPKEEEKKRFWSFTTTASSASSDPTASNEDRMETGTL